MPDDTDPLLGLEATVIGIILLRIRIRARIALEGELKSLEEQTGRELPMVRMQLESIFGEETPLPALEEPRVVSFDAEPQPARRGRKPKIAQASDPDE